MNQQGQIKIYLESGRTLWSLEARKYFGCELKTLRTIISNLRAKKVPIDTENFKTSRGPTIQIYSIRLKNLSDKPKKVRLFDK